MPRAGLPVAVESLYVLVEEPSMEVALEALLPKMLRPEVAVNLRQFQCKSELLQRLQERLEGYAQWLPETAVVLVVIDRDDDDCKVLKAKLESFAHRAGVGTKGKPKQGRFQVISRIAIEELEAWFFGDWLAMRAAYPKLEATVDQRSGFRDPDAIKGGTWEAMERVLQRKGYYKTGLRKMELARAVAAGMDPGRNRSASFCCLRDALAEL